MVPLDDVSVADLVGERQMDGAGTRGVVLSFLRQNPDGASTQMVAQAIGLSVSRTRQILDQLVHEREAYDRDIPGVKGKLYYPNGRLIHQYLVESREMGSQIFRFSFHEGTRSPARLQIQERSFSLLGGEKMEGSIYIDTTNTEALIEALTEMVAKYNQFTTGNVPSRK